MKELTIEEKAKRYDEAIKKAGSLYKTAEPMSGCNVIIETLFPELKESEDERIRKALINGFNKLDKSAVWYNGITNAQILDWLEKQGEQKSTDKEMKTLLQTEYEKGRADVIAEQKPWSEEDERKLTDVIVALSEYANGNIPYILPSILLEDVDWLKSLSPQSRWKPSDEQMEAFHTVVYLKDLDCYGGLRDNLLSLYNDLKKLKGE